MSTRASKFLGEVLKYILNPVLFISVIGPLLMENNLDLLNIHNARLTGNLEFTALLNNKYNYALNSYNIQLFVLILSVVFTFIETARVFYKIASSHPFDLMERAIKNSSFTITIIIISILVVCGFGMVFISGSFASEHIIAMYLKDQEEPLFSFIGINIPFPPVQSLLTIWRFFIVGYGILFLIWEKNSLPILKRKLNEMNK